MSKAKKDASEEVVHPQGMVLYADGSCRPNPGPGGWGIHGYLYQAVEPKKGAGSQHHLLSDSGYVPKTDVASGKKIEQVTPVHYVDGFGSFLHPITNNIGELAAGTAALKHAANYEVKKVNILTDSQYVIKGIESHVDKWAKNGWLKADGMEVANKQYWKDLVAARDDLKQRGVSVRFSWVKGHSDILGNIIADKLAGFGTKNSQVNEGKNQIDTVPAEGYWKHDVNKSPLLAQRRMYFNTLAESNTPGLYYMGEHGKEDNLLGKRTSDGSFSLVCLKQPDHIVEMVRNHHIKIAEGADTIVMVRMDKLFSQWVHRDLSNYGMIATTQPDAKYLSLFVHDMSGGDDEDEEDTMPPLSKELRPAGLATRAIEAIENLHLRLREYQEGKDSVVVTDLTTHLYETTVAVSKKGITSSETKLKAIYNVGYAAMKVEANFRGKEEIETAPVTLTLGIDMLDRNSLKRLEDLNPRVLLVTWNEAPGIFRFATVVECDEGYGIWAGVYSNIRVV